MKKIALLIAALITAGAAGTTQADTLSDIKSSGKITVGIDPTFPPYEFTNDKGEITGYSVAIMQSFAKDLGVKLEFQKTAFSGILPGLISGSFNAEGSSLNVTAERAKKVLFTVPYSKTVNGVLVREADVKKFSGKTLSPEQLSGLSGAVKSASVPEQLLKGFNETLTKEGKKPITIISVDTLDQTVSTLMTKRADFVFDDISVLAPIVKKYPNKVAQVGEAGPSQWMAWATRKDDTRLNKAISDHILAMQKDGELTTLQKQYLGTTFTVPASDFIPQE
ncbi:putative periplasmic substrate-binding component of an ABC superfamily amino acid transporter [Rahnella aquatilis CIP 78.65 = ATCC 33071]|uniref:Periplasmic component of amino acid ABC-type transporter/signal transduction system n=1 Tax=Rahnella aquatilis (strain ATCC 33071 / DSM 4594 / JCM 1683 / NBRC 105701 / NCIMB 13365 / CIP 78.65) TaxID=745277 RepID=H2J0U6_RAHAC|nr:transporter substrate-binding domain-containing protein [Rahnella aquatilis]AEX52259.1 periplasmic component of amino acid ABC-type transporter/signal transduction system [Rahnella aquatilis CIP 78.65 = ATCC 33071]KFD09710.1 putative periplasmic substrate-binding component of an ABC superfamily amino acid transporter [Rahnella aquatilis CIP 78.65 = ATCC 33071]